MTKYRAWFGVSAKVIENCSHANSQGVMSSESVKAQLLVQVLRLTRTQDLLHVYAHGPNNLAEAELFRV